MFGSFIWWPQGTAPAATPPRILYCEAAGVFDGVEAFAAYGGSCQAFDASDGTEAIDWHAGDEAAQVGDGIDAADWYAGGAEAASMFDGTEAAEARPR